MLQQVRAISKQLSLQLITSAKWTLHQVKFVSYTKWSLYPTQSEVCALHQVVCGLLLGVSARAGNLFTYLHDSMGTRDVTLAYDDDAKGNMDSKDVTLAYDDDAKGTMSSGDVTLAYDDAKGNVDSKDVILAYDDEAKDSNDIMDVTLSYDDFRYKKCLQERINWGRQSKERG